MMLIRTQDKKGIVNLDNMESLWISEVDSGFDITIAFSDGAYVIGQYTSETQVLEVLDLIEEEYKRAVTNIVGSMMVIPPKVFHMPEDWNKV